MTQTALTQLQQQIEAVRREAFAAGYATAMQAIREVALKPGPDAEAPSTPQQRERARRTRGSAQPAAQRPARAARSAGRTAQPAARSSARRPPRGTNARLVEEVLQSMAPGAVHPAEIRAALQRDKGVALPFTSIRHALGQLESRRAAEQVGNTRTWRHRGTAEAVAGDSD